MANTKISALTSATTPLAGTEVLPIVQSSATVKVATNDLTVRNLRANATTGILQVTGPTAASTRVMTTPDANFTVARTDAAQTFTGTQTFAGINISSIVNGIGKTGTFTRNSGTASGNVSYTGVGFQPSLLVFYGAIDTINDIVISSGTAAAGRSLYVNVSNSLGADSQAVAFYYRRDIGAGNFDIQSATIASMDSDGFTLAYTRTRGGTGTSNSIIVNYIAYK